MVNPIIEMNDLTKNYDSKCAVDHLNLSIYPGEVFGLLGPNGAGKSTTILMMLGLTEPSEGSVTVCGYNSTREPQLVKKKVGYLPDNIGFYEDRTGLENLVYTALLNGIPESKAKERAHNLLKEVGLEHAGHKKAGKYSRGMKQRLGLADVLIKEPEVVILDEPTLGIDPKGVQELLQLIKILSKEHGITILLSSHHLHQVQQICDRVGLFVEGKMLAVGNIRELAHELFQNDGIEIHVKISNITEELLNDIGELKGIVSVKQVTDQTLSIKSEFDITADIAKLIIHFGGSLQELTVKEYGLDEIYHEYFEGGTRYEAAPS